MKKNSKTIFIITLVIILIIAANIAETLLVFNVTVSNTKNYGADRLEVISGELEKTINDTQLSTLRFAMEIQPLISDREKCESFIRQKKKDMYKATNGVCFNVYLATEDWYYIPDFDSPDDYEIKKRSWYIGAMRQQGVPFVTDPYIDAMTGNICFSVSVLLPDNKSIACMDYTMENIQHHIIQMNIEGNQNSVIVTNDGIIAGCSDETLVGKKLIQAIPDYAGIFSLVKNSDKSVSINQRGDNLFATQSGFGWYLIVSENNWTLYKDSYIGMFVMLFISLSIFTVVLILYFMSTRSEKKIRDTLVYNKKFVNDIASELQEPLEKIINSSSDEYLKHSTDYEQEFAIIRESGERLSDTVSKLRSYSALALNEKNNEEENKPAPEVRDVTVSKRFRAIILAALLLITSTCMYINISASFSRGTDQMQKTASSYEYQLSEWINTQKSILDMFCSTISTNPQMLDNYEEMVEYLDRITKQYPEISASYMTNPDLEHTVIMNNGWEPDEDWHVEERDWYKDLMNTENNWIISSPYYDEQTGLYCVTFAEKVFDDRTGKFLGNFGIDFYMDKLVNILGNSYSDKRYAFLSDAKGEIINHPYGMYQMTENSSYNIINLPYNSAAPNGKDVVFIKDYDNRFKAVISSRNESSGFLIFVVDDVFSIYKDVFIYGSICMIVLSACVILIYRLISNLITLQNRANIKLRESAAAAIAADKAKSNFLAQMSHEIRTPINAVLGMNEMILHESNDKNIKEYATNIQSSGKTLLSLINSVLDFSKIEDNKMKIIPAEYHTAVLINDLVTSISTRAAEKDLKLIVKADELLPSILMGDEVRIKQVILNLLTNAVKYTEKGSVTLLIKEEERNGNFIQLYVEVKDTGIGIRKEDIDGLFESFKRLDEKRNRNIEGTGLGMSIVTRLLEMMDSRLNVQSVYEEGSVFSFRLRQEIINPNPMGKYEDFVDTEFEDNYQGRHLYAPKASVLVVDDNTMNLKVAENFLRLYSIEADTVDSSEKCLSIIKNKTYDIVLLDHMMPKMDGIEVLREIKKNSLVPPSTKIIVLTANAITGAKNMYISEGFDGYLSKPIENKSLEKILIKYLPDQKKQFRKFKSPEPSDKSGSDNNSFTMEEIIAVRDICPEINIAAGMGNCMDSREFYADTLSGFVESERSAELNDAYEKKDLKLYRIIVHSIKSSARTIGADVVSDHAKTLEFAAADNNIDLICQKHESFAEEYQKLIEKTRRIIELWKK